MGFRILIELANCDISEQISNRLGQIPAERRRALLITFLISILAYGFYAFAPVLGREELFYIGQRGITMNNSYAQAGRPLAWLISHKVLAGSFIPFVNITISSLILSYSGVLLANSILNINKTLDIALVASLFAIFPLFTQSQGFQLWNVAYSISICLPLIACHFSTSKTWKFLPLSSVLLTITLTIYQSSISIFAVAVLVYLLSKVSRDSMQIDTFKKYLAVASKSSGALILSIVLYAPIYFSMTKNAIGYTAYQNEKIGTFEQLIGNLIVIFNIGKELIYGYESWLYRENFVVLFVVVSIIFGFGVISQKESIGKKLIRISTVLFFLLVLVPSLRLEGLVIANIGRGPRLWVAIAVFMAGVSGITLLQRSLIIKNLSFICCTLLLFSFLLFHNVQSFFLWTEREHDLKVANRVAQRIENHKDFNPGKTYFLYVSGTKGTNATSSALYKVPFSYQAIKPNSDSFSALLNFVGFTNFKYDRNNSNNPIFISNMNKISEQMPEWPAPGAIKFLTNDRVIIKF